MTKNKIKSLIIVAAILIVLALAGCLIAQAVIIKQSEPVLAQMSESTENDMQVSGSNKEVSTLSLAAPRSIAKTTAVSTASDVAVLSSDTYTSLGVALSESDIAKIEESLTNVSIYNTSYATVVNNMNSQSRSDVLIIKGRMGGGQVPIVDVFWALLPKENVFPDLGLCEVYSVVSTYNEKEVKCLSDTYTQFTFDNFYPFQIAGVLNKPWQFTYNLIKKGVSLPDDPVKEGHTFMGWYLDSAFTQPYNGQPIYKDTQLYAKFQINSYTVTYDFNGGTGSPYIQHVDWNTAATLNTPTRDGYGFEGWFMSDGTEYTNQPIKSDITLTAHWYRNRFNVTFNSDGGSAVQDRVVMLNKTFSYPLTIPTKEGYNFLGWYMADGTQYIDQPVTGDMTLTAHWEIKVYTVNFYVDGELYSTMEVEHGTQLVQVASEQNLVVMSVYSESPGFSAEALKTKGVTTDLTVTAVEMSNKDKVVNTIKNNKWKIVGGVVAGVVFISAIAAIVGYIKRKNVERYDYE